MERTELYSFPTKFRTKKLQQHASVLQKAFYFLETTSLKTMLTSAVKRRELINFTIFSESAYTCNLFLYSIVRNKHNY